MKQSGKALAVHAHARTEQVRDRLRDAMKKIELEIEDNNGIYPFHGGRLSLSEVCRRAGVHKVTLQGSSHKTTTKPMVENWLLGITKALTTGRKTVRKTVTARADDWEAKYRDIANKFNEMYAIEIISRDEELRKLRERNAFLEAEILRLQSELSGGKVVQISNTSGKGGK